MGEFLCEPPDDYSEFVGGSYHNSSFVRTHTALTKPKTKLAHSCTTRETSIFRTNILHLTKVAQDLPGDGPLLDISSRMHYFDLHC